MASYFCIPPPVWTRDILTVRGDEERKRKKIIGERRKKGGKG